MKRSIHAFLFLVLCGYGAHAQLTSCAQTLRFARSTYDQGRLHEIPGLFDQCLQNGFSQEEKVEAYKLLCLTYIYLEEPQKADEAMLNLLRTNHYFEIKQDTDPAEFVALYRTFRTDPIYRIGVKMGVNGTLPNVVSYLPSNELKSEYDYGFSFQGGFAADVPLKVISGRATFHPELTFAMRSFKYTNEGSFTDLDADGNTFSREYETNAVERHAWISLPLSLQYQFLSEKVRKDERMRDRTLKPYIGLGISTDYLISARNTFRRTKQDATSLDEQNIDLIDNRTNINISAIASVGVKLRVTGGFAIAELRYAHGISNLNSAKDIYANFDRVNPTGGYVDGIFKLNSLSITVGYVYNRFNPKKIRK
jgi:hypothetical protein